MSDETSPALTHSQIELVATPLTKMLNAAYEVLNGFLDTAFEIWTRVHPRLVPILVLWGVVIMSKAVWNDVDRMVAVSQHNYDFEAKHCAEQYAINRCEPDQRVPQLFEVCAKWERCMKAPKQAVTAKLIAQTLAEVINAFVSPLSLKAVAMIAFLVWVVITAIVKNPPLPSAQKADSELACALIY